MSTKKGARKGQSKASKTETVEEVAAADTNATEQTTVVAATTAPSVADWTQESKLVSVDEPTVATAATSSTNTNTNSRKSVADFDRNVVKAYENKNVSSLTNDDLLMVLIVRGEEQKNPVISGGCEKLLKQINRESLGPRRGPYDPNYRRNNYNNNNNNNRRQAPSQLDMEDEDDLHQNNQKNQRNQKQQQQQETSPDQRPNTTQGNRRPFRGPTYEASNRGPTHRNQEERAERPNRNQEERAERPNRNQEERSERPNRNQEERPNRGQEERTRPERQNRNQEATESNQSNQSNQSSRNRGPRFNSQTTTA